MAKPIIAAKKPSKVSVQVGEKYFWCQCGRSSKQPFCDGSHKGTGITPLMFVAKESKDVVLCNCKGTKTPPFCDGTHAKLSQKVGEELDLDPHKKAVPTPEEPFVKYIHELAKNGLKNVGDDGPMTAMGVPISTLPKWDDIQFITAQLHKKPLQDHCMVETEVVIGPNAKKPLVLKIPLFVSDMSFGSLSEEAKISLAKGAELAGTGICSGEGGMLQEEQESNTKYLYELASAKFGFSLDKMSKIQAFHFKAGQAAKTGTGGHLPGNKVTEKIAAVRGLKAGEDAISPATFLDLVTVDDYKNFANNVREASGGVPIGFKISAQHIEKDIEFAIKASADYIILDGRGGGTGAAPEIFRDNISVPTIAALARARHYLDKYGHKDISLVVTGGLRTAADFSKALALGADAIAIANSAIQAIGCIGARICNTNMCPSGVATQDPELRKLIDVDVASKRLATYLESTVELMKVLSRACGHDDLGKFTKTDLTTWKMSMAELTGIEFGGYDPKR